jgi:hypothetical protein
LQGTHKSPICICDQVVPSENSGDGGGGKTSSIDNWGQNILQIMTIRTTPLSIDNNISTMFAFLRHKGGMFAIKIERYIAN